MRTRRPRCKKTSKRWARSASKSSSTWACSSRPFYSYSMQFFLVCFLQLPLNLSAGVQHSASVQYPNPPCDLQVLSRLTIWLVQPEIQHCALPPPCVQQCVDPEFALVAQPSNLHVPCAPCLPQRPRLITAVLQPSTLHSFLVCTCLPHLPRTEAAVVHRSCNSSQEQNPLPPCGLQRPRA